MKYFGIFLLFLGCHVLLSAGNLEITDEYSYVLMSKGFARQGSPKIRLRDWELRRERMKALERSSSYALNNLPHEDKVFFPRFAFLFPLFGSAFWKFFQWILAMFFGGVPEDFLVETCILFFPTILASLCGVVGFLWMREEGEGDSDDKISFLWVFLWLFGTIQAYYSRRYLSENLAVLGFLIAMLGWKKKEIQGALICGLGVGIAFLTKALYGIAMIPFSIAWFFCKSYDVRKRFLMALCSSAVFLFFVAAYAYYNRLRYGSFFDFGYRPFVLLGSNLYHQGFDHPIQRGLAGLLLSPSKGIYFLNPLCLLALFGVVQAWRQARETFFLLLFQIVFFLLVVSAWWAWEGGAQILGPRLMIPLLPFFLFPLRFVLKDAVSKGTKWIFIFLFFCVLLQTFFLAYSYDDFMTKIFPGFDQRSGILYPLLFFPWQAYAVQVTQAFSQTISTLLSSESHSLFFACYRPGVLDFFLIRLWVSGFKVSSMVLFFFSTLSMVSGVFLIRLSNQKPILR